jgi:hypothetical protein
MIKVYAALFVLAVGLAGATAAQAEGGCGWGYHRGPYGGCRPNGYGPGPAVVPRAGVVVGVPGAGIFYAPIGRPCPYGYHLGPQGRRCWPNG